ncbi:MAG: flagellar FliJ family protein [Alphaproteobacteria bacterium]
MKSLTTLIRIKQREMDALRRQQDQLQKQREELHKIIDLLNQQLVHELKTASAMPEMAHFFGDFAAAIKKRQQAMHLHLRKVEAELDKLAAQLREIFSEMKKYELALGNWEKRRADAAKKRDAQEMDEIAIRGYVRRDAV